MQVAVADSLDPQALQQLTVLRRKEVQRQRLGDYEEAVLSLKSKVRDAEGQAMRETVQDKVCPPWSMHFAAARPTSVSHAVSRSTCKGSMWCRCFSHTSAVMMRLIPGMTR